jgi:rare lipoprotein A
MGRMTRRAKASWVATLLAFVLISGAFDSNAQSETGVASYYKSGSLTANGERFDPQGLTAAHRSLFFNTRVRVTSVDNGRSVVVRINDRGPFVSRRIIDLSFGAAQVIGLHTSGVANVSMEVLR